MTLTIKSSATGDTAATACDAFTWYGTEYTASGTQTHTFDGGAANDCDSTVTLTLTILPSATLSVTNGDQSIQTGEAIVTIQITNTNSTISVENLPSGLTYNSVTNQISGTPAAGGDYTITITATSDQTPECGTTSTDVTIAVAEGVECNLPGRFTINASGDQVQFSCGNLQWLAKAADGYSDNTWRFAEHQYDFVGGQAALYAGGYSTTGSYQSVKMGNNTYAYNDYSTTAQAQNATAWIDLFPWGTSGWSGSGVESPYYMPYVHATATSSFFTGNLTGANANADWGVFNNIVNGGGAGLWRTMTKDEWTYLLNTRTDAASKKSLGNIQNPNSTWYNDLSQRATPGLILLPDDFTLPTGCTFSSSYSSSNYAGYYTNYYTQEQWALMEAAGAVFLPAAGYRTLHTVYTSRQYCSDHYGVYWTATTVSDSWALSGGESQYSWYVQFDHPNCQNGNGSPYIAVTNDQTYIEYDLGLWWGSHDQALSVRLVHDFEPCSVPGATTTTSECGSYTWAANGETYTTDQTGLTHTLYSVDGCDSVVTLNLTILPEVTLSVTNSEQTISPSDAISDIVITNTNSDISFTPSTLPSALTYNSATGHISGTPATTDTIRFTITATNNTGNGCPDKSEDVTITIDENALSCVLGGKFTINASGDQVQFSCGNLQYLAKSARDANGETYPDNTWRFANYQYDFCGGTCTYGCSYVNISSVQMYDGTWCLNLRNTTNATRQNATTWIDLFGWGTSGWSGSGATAYQPYSINSSSSDYLTTSIAGTNADWGQYNTIYNGGRAGLWRVLTRDEWNYLLNTRTNATQKKSLGQVYISRSSNYIHGMILLPDDFTLPSGCSFSYNYTPSYTGYSTNTYTESQWDAMEDAGAVFLPMTGYIGYDGTTPGYYPLGEAYLGSYWTATTVNTTYAYTINFSQNSQSQAGSISIGSSEYYGGHNRHNAVRLVHDFEPCSVDGVTTTVTACGSYTWAANGVTYTTDQTGLTYTLYDRHGCDSVETLNLTIATPPTLSVDPLVQSVIDGSAITNVVITNTNSTISVTGLPAGVSYNSGTNTISGTPTAGTGSYSYTITATASSAACENLTLNGTITVTEGCTPGGLLGRFSVSPTNKVNFSQGNLQYLAKANGSYADGTWRFALNQYDFVGGNNSTASEGSVSGSGDFGNVYKADGTTKCSNNSVGTTYDGWIDLFCWGTSGWNSGANKYLPTDYSNTGTDYYPGGSNANDLTGAYINADWGVYNSVVNGGNAPGLWRLLTYAEWNYMLNTRTGAASKKALATVNDVKGLVLLPDDWTLPSGCTFTAYASGQAWTANTYTAAQWELMEANGAAFLPSAGYRGTGTSSANSWFWGNAYNGRYWTSTHYTSGSTYAAYQMYWYGKTIVNGGNTYIGNSTGANNRAQGASVRLVKDYDPSITIDGAVINQTACDSYTWDLTGQTYTETGEYTKTYVSRLCGYDSIVTLNLTINHNSSTGYRDTACNTYTWAAAGTKGHGDGEAHTESGSYTGPSYDDANGCASVDTLKLVINVSDNQTYEVVASTANYTWAAAGDKGHGTGTTYDIGGVYAGPAYTDGNGCEAHDTLKLTMGSVEGRLNGLFSVSASTRVYFSQGNLQYLAKATGTYADNSWRFAEHQYDAIGNAVGNNTALATRATQTNWIDLFAYGTSGWQEGAPNYLPYTRENTAANYLAQHLTGDYENADWAAYNYILNALNGSQNWRTLSQAEWYYLLYTRTDATQKRSFGKAAGVPGIFLLPDEWTLPDGLTFTANYTTNFTTNNQYTEEQWAEMEEAGAVFLPAAGYQAAGAVAVSYPPTGTPYGRYWSASNVSAANSYAFQFYGNGTVTTAINGSLSLAKTIASAVRPVYDYRCAVPGSSQNVEVCDRYTWAADGHTYSNSITTTHKFTTSSGCDSLVQLNLTVKASGSSAYTVQQHEAFTWAASGSYGHGDGTEHTEGGTFVGPRYDGTNGCDAYDTLHLQLAAIDGQLEGQFSVAEDRKVYFSQGNLQYLAKDDGEYGDNTWRFAEHQYDYIGSVAGNNTAEANRAIQTSWIDLFGYGTSSWNSGAIGYNPFYAVNTAANYIKYNLTGDYAEADWGIYNAIVNGGNASGLWRTLSMDEVYYLLNERADAHSKRALGQANGINGLIILPDTWTLPAGLTFVPDYCINFTTNSYSAAEWAQMEAAGAVFLPTAGQRSAVAMAGVGTYGRYWTSTLNGTQGTATNAYNLYFIVDADNTTTVAIQPAASQTTAIGSAVRLVREVPSCTKAGISATQTACDSYVWSVNGETYSQSGTYYDTAIVGGCLQSNKLTLTINRSESQSYNVMRPDSYTWAVDGDKGKGDGLTHTESGDYLGTAYTSANGCEARDTLHLTIGGLPGQLGGLFSVADDKQVYFSQGNLQYLARAAGDYADNTFRFAEHQYDFVGNATATVGNVYIDDVKSNNAYMDAAYDGWVDLFGYGTSGYYNNQIGYRPWYWTATTTYYLALHLTGANANSDWGVYNPIVNGGNRAGEWRTLESSEWTYLLNTRDHAKRSFATITGVGGNSSNVLGLVILPDEWVLPEGCSYTGDITANFTTNTYTAAQWAMMEENGAVFLPAAGSRSGQTYTAPGTANATTSANYRSATYNSGNNAYTLIFYFNATPTTALQPAYQSLNRMAGASVRLVRDAATCTEAGVTLNQTACDKYTWSETGETYYESLSKSVVSTTGSGCEKVNTLNLTINRSGSQTYHVSQNSSFTWAASGDYGHGTGTTYTTSGKYVGPRYDGTNSCDAYDTLYLTIASLSGQLDAQFSVSATQKVYFSQGNLQYLAKAAGGYADNTWRFAEHQYDFVGSATTTVGNVSISGTKSSNANISAAYAGWIDLFGYGTSSWNSGAVGYMPWYNVNTVANYLAQSFTGDYIHADWGIHNAIFNGGNDDSLWRTLTSTEMTYLINGRADAAQKRTFATITGVGGSSSNVLGLVILPDTYVQPAGIPYTGDVTANFTTNVYSAAEWAEMEAAGAVFLPSAGYRSTATVTEPGANGYGRYWTSTYVSGTVANALYFYGNAVPTTALQPQNNAFTRDFGHSVRLVRNVPTCDVAGTTTTTTACDEYTWAINSTRYTESGTYDYRSVVGGCEKIDRLNLTINKSESQAYMLLRSEPYMWPASGTMGHGDGLTHNASCDCVGPEYASANGCPAYDTLHLTIGGLEGQLGGKFSVSADKQVYFSKGNLQYLATSNGTYADNSFRFAEHQYDYIGAAAGNNTAIPARATQSNWIDLFGYATSGWQSDVATAVGYRPWHNTTTIAEYLPQNLTGSYVNGDWGHFNPIVNGGSVAGQWRTLSSTEWSYVINDRPNAASKRSLGTVNGVAGLIILPDDWVLPSGSVFTENYTTNYTTNVYTEAQWTTMEANGAVFLPAAGYRNTATVTGANTTAKYWSSTYSTGNFAYCLYFVAGTLTPASTGNTTWGMRTIGASVRLVHDAADCLAATVNVNQTACDKYTWAKNSTTYTESGDYSYVETDGSDCELVTVLHLTINSSGSTAYNVEQTTSFTWPSLSSYGHGDGRTHAAGGTFVGPRYSGANGCDAYDTLHLTLGVIDGQVSGRFSVAADKQVYFSHGNLQYLSKSDGTYNDNTFRFADNQYTYIGAAAGNNVAEATRPNSTTWIDLFGFGTSGWSGSGAIGYLPWYNSTTQANYIAASLTGANANADWGVYNAIFNGGNTPGLWRTLTSDEFTYLINTRANAAQKRALGQAAGYMGLILLPDDFVMPDGLTFVGDYTTNFTVNNYTAAQWAEMEANGAVFLPASGFRNNHATTVSNPATQGHYWSSSWVSGTTASHLYFVQAATPTAGVQPAVNHTVQMGDAVRLVREAPACDTAGTITSTEACDTYDWATSGQTYTEDGTYVHRSLVGGCERIDKLNLTIKHSESQAYMLLQSEPYTWAVMGSGLGIGDGLLHSESGDFVGEEYESANGCSARDTLHLTIGGLEGQLGGLFSVSADKQVYFSRGNLQWLATSDGDYADNTWRFALHQYDFIGAAAGNNVAVPARATQSAWIDLFGYGTSGWQSGYIGYRPWHNTTTTSEYMAQHLSGSYVNGDWGIYNAIINGGNIAGQWRTLTSTEWTYLINGRPNAAEKRSLGQADGKNGLILLPDDWTLPAGLSFTGNYTTNYTTNSYSAADWAKMEQNGAVFLPAAGYRNSNATTVTNANTYGHYWSSSWISGTNIYCLQFYANATQTTALQPTLSNSVVMGNSVRLVHDAADCLAASVNVDQTACDSYTWAKSGVTYTESGDYSYVETDDEECEKVTVLHLTIQSSGSHAYTVRQSEAFTWPASGSYGHGDGTNHTASGTFVGPRYDGTNSCDAYDTLHLRLDYLTGQVDGQFSVAADRKIYFSQGNLQYLDKGNDDYADHTWRFAEHQYDYVGNATAGVGNVYLDDVKSSNTLIASGYTGWIDLFGFGTSGWYTGTAALVGYRPWHSTTTVAEYLNANLTGTYANSDWGIYNAIINGGNNAGQWRTLTSDEITYLINTREDAASKRALATVAGVTGLILLPDTWTQPDGLTFIGDYTTNYTTNVYDADDWALMEQNGAVFLPCAGTRSGTGFTASVGRYWTSTYVSGNNSNHLYFTTSATPTAGVTVTTYTRVQGNAVRLVRDVAASECAGTTTTVANACDSYTWSGNTYTESGTYEASVTDAGCTKVNKLVLTVNSSESRPYYVTTDAAYTWPTSGDKGRGTGISYTLGGTYLGPTSTVNGCTSRDTLHLVLAAVDGQLPGRFAVSATDTVYFSSGNLQYLAADLDGISGGTFRLAEHQYDFVGSTTATVGNVYSANLTKSSNQLISATYAGWVDLFGYATSGNQLDGKAGFYPYYSNTTTSNYLAQNLTGSYATGDWGVFNAILGGGNTANMWRTLSSDEWTYLLSTRTDAPQKRAFGTITGVNGGGGDVLGLIILPDHFTMPDGLSYTGDILINFTTNVYDADQWAQMEANGAVFLPSAGYRTSATAMTAPGTTGIGCYWSANTASAANSYGLYFYSNVVPSTALQPSVARSKMNGNSVRLVRNAGTCEAVGTPQNVTACNEYTWSVTGETYTDDYTQVIASTNGDGCNVITTFRLTINKPQSTPYNVLESSTYTWGTDPATNGGHGHGNGTTYTEAGTYTGTSYTDENGCTAVDTLHLVLGAVDGQLTGKFSVAADKQVFFSKGNLQYLAAYVDNYPSDTWRFAEHQYDYVGNAASGTVYANGGNVKSNNNLLSATYHGWIDLFGYGCDGFNAGKAGYMPYYTTTTAGNYLAANFNGGNSDWGVYCAIDGGGNTPGLWRTLTQAEWQYLINTRGTDLRSYGTIRGVGEANAEVPGLIILPDDFVLPSGLSYTGNILANWTTNAYSVEQWERMESAGAVFLPMAGYRSGTTTTVAIANGTKYWSSTNNSANYAYSLTFKTSTLTYNKANTTAPSDYKYIAAAVRLVHDVPTCIATGRTDNVEACDSYTWAENGETYTESTVKTILSDEDGCDRIVTLNLTINHNSSTPYNVAQSGSFTWAASGDYGHGNGTTYTTSQAAVVGPSYNTAEGCASNDTLHLTLGAVDGQMTGEFTVASGVTVHFSPGNLQYQGSTSKFRFAEHQYDYIGYDGGNTTADPDRQTQTEWIDLFGYGTSGWNNGKAGYQPTYYVATAANYIYQDLYNASYTNADWGMYNPIVGGGNNTGMWRTLSSAEWTYLFNTRADAADKRTFATVNDVYGLVILPDHWTLPDGVNYIGGYVTDFNTNVYDVEQWAKMESAGAVFLPAAGYRSSALTMAQVGTYGYYWSSEYVSSTNSSGLRFYANSLSPAVNSATYLGLSVRLVRNSASCGVAGTTTDVTACNTYEWAATGETYTESGVYNVVTTEGGCDKVNTLNLTITKTECRPYYVTSADAYTWEVGGTSGNGTGTTYDRSGTYLGTLVSVAGCDSRDTLHLVLNAVEGQLAGEFSVAADKKVYFSQGNLWYQASTNTYRLADHQYDYIGSAVGNTTAVASRPYQEEWIDLFGYGTSGWNSGAYGYRPWYTTNTASTAAAPYYLGQNLTGDYANADWGVFNAIENAGNTPGLWRTLTSAEWTYLLSTRTDAANKRTFATVDGVLGMVILPDHFTLPDGCRYEGNVTANFTINVYTAEAWAQMESAGAVFLPAAGYRSAVAVTGPNARGHYWSSTSATVANSNYLYFIAGTLTPAGAQAKFTGSSVRLVREKNSCDGAGATTTAEACDSYTWAKNSQTYSESGIYNYSTVESGCNKTYTLDLTITSSESKAYYISTADSYTWRPIGATGRGSGETYTQSGTYLGSTNTVNGCTSRDTLHLTLGIVDGQLAGAFAVSATDTVYFSKGNLQYQASTGIFRFADNQYDRIGAAVGNTTVIASRATQSNWIDLFGYGTSGYDNGSLGYYPWYGTNTPANYIAANISGTNSDWGVYNAIENGGGNAGLWRTLAADEMLYLINSRTNADQKRSFATVNGITGLILLPDQFAIPASCLFVSNVSSDYTSNVYDADQWAEMENAGAVFLPLAGYNAGSSITMTVGKYWTSTYSTGNFAYSLYFAANPVPTTALQPNKTGTATPDQRSIGAAVRLVRNARRCEVAGTSTSATACDNYTWASNSRTYDATGTYSHETTETVGGKTCTKVNTLTLTINSSESHAYYVAAAGAYTWPLSGDKGRGTGTTITTAGTHLGTMNTVNGCPSQDTLHLTFGAVEGSVAGLFTVASGRQVYFADGNLRYNANTETFRFADNQYDVIGNAVGNTVADPLRQTQIAEIDIFNYGTSGWNSGVAGYMPWYNVMTAANHYASNMSGTNADWGVYNAIEGGGNAAGLWRTLTDAEWTYLLSTREGATNKRSFATVNSRLGLVILPDNFNLPSSCLYVGNIVDVFTTNVYTADQWADMEANGAVFLPVAGYRSAVTTINSPAVQGHYWASTQSSATVGYRLYFLAGTLNTAYTGLSKHQGASVRLVHDAGTCAVAGTSTTVTACDSYTWSANDQTYTESGVYNHATTEGGCTKINSLDLTINRNSSTVYVVEKPTSYMWSEYGSDGKGDNLTHTETGVYTGTVYTDDNGCTSRDTLLLFIGGGITGAVSGHPFTVSAGHTVYFSKGNLQYQASTNTYKFADNQYTYIGSAAGNTTAAASRPTNASWIDLFTYGGSGWRGSGAYGYQPWYNVATANHYLSVNTVDAYADADYGVYNRISNGGDHAGLWRTLTSAEWQYLFRTRANATTKCGLATVVGIKCLVILPDDWTLPSGASWSATTANVTTNNYNADTWALMEANGAVALPFAGWRTAVTTVGNAASYGYYRTSTSGYTWRFYVNSTRNTAINSLSTNNYYGCSVRLVHDAPSE